jgi:hypothetical protein
LHEYLSQLDHLGVVFQLFGQINHLVGLILLVTDTGVSEESIEASNLEGIALRSSSSSVLDEISIMRLINR